MDAMITGKNNLDQFIAGLTALISHGLENLFGSGVNTPVFGDVTWADLGTVLCLVLFILLVNGLAVAFLRHKTGQTAATEGEATATPCFWRAGQAVVFADLDLWRLFGRHAAVVEIAGRTRD